MLRRADVDTPLARRDFLKAAGGSACSLLVAPLLADTTASHSGPSESAGQLPLPGHIREILGSLAPLKFDAAGYLNRLIEVRGTFIPGRVEVVPTRWNLEHNTLAYRMRTDQRLGVVLHWDGAPTGNRRSVEQLVRGLNESVHFVSRARMTNSAHFGVGSALISTARDDPTAPLGVAQLQHPWRDGTPLIASHLNWRVGKPDMLHDTPAQCLAVMRALGLDTGLRSMYEGVWLDPNYRTLAIEISGRRFDRDFPLGLPPTQVTANLLSLLVALSEHHSIGPWDVMGHLELQYDKPDPGKLFTGLVRYLLGIAALVQPGSRLSQLAFGGVTSHPQLQRAARLYFSALSEYVRRLVPPSDHRAWLDYCGHNALVDFLANESAAMYERKLFAATGGTDR